MNRFNPKHCTSSVRGVKKAGQLEYILTGTHAFQWSINVLFKKTIVRSTTYPNRIAAMREWDLIRI